MADFRVTNAEAIPTPALLIYREAVAENIRRIGAFLGGFERLRPHVKTHKMSRVAAMQMAAGIDRFKCATPREAAMLAAMGVTDILVAYPVLGAQVDRVVGLKGTYPEIDLKVIADSARGVQELSSACVAAGTTVGVSIDLDTGMHRTGCAPGRAALDLARTVSSLPGLTFEGLHAYDGHVTQPDEAQRRRTAEAAIQEALDCRRAIEADGLPVKTLVASGSPGFVFTSRIDGVDEVSPGTWIFWDWNYDRQNPGLFRTAALVLTTVISTTGPDLITLDAGAKSIAPDVSAPHFKVLDFTEDLEFVRRNEEHQLLRLPAGCPRPDVGHQFYLVPGHVCTTVNLWDEACVIDGEGRFVETWPVDARGH